jgi:diaminopimelate decarboxylase
MPTLEAAIERLQAHEHSIQFISLQGLDQGVVEECWIATNLRQQDESIQRLRAKFRIPRVFCDATRYLLADTHVLFARVIGEKPAFDAEGNMVGHQYYIDDGCYGSFGRMHVTGGDQHGSESAPPPFTVQVTGKPTELGGDGAGSVATIWGQTCDSIDCVAQQVVLPNLELGSWLSFTGLDQTGTTYSTQFNGFPAPSKKYCIQTGVIAM